MSPVAETTGAADPHARPEPLAGPGQPRHGELEQARPCHPSRRECLSAAGRPAEALEACRRFLDRWHESGGTGGGSTELCEIADILATTGQHESVRAAAMLLPPKASRWRDALLAVADERYSNAAAVYEEIGSQPLAANAHVLATGQAAQQGRDAEARGHAGAVIAFAEKSGASLYLERAAEVVRAV